MNCRLRLCHLGEELMPPMLQVWADMRPGAALEQEIVDFFSLQIRAHHPKGAKTPDEGTAVCLSTLKNCPLTGGERRLISNHQFEMRTGYDDLKKISKLHGPVC